MSTVISGRSRIRGTVPDPELADVYTGELRTTEADAVVMVTARLPTDGRLTELTGLAEESRHATVRGVGDCCASGTIAAAVWSGRRAAEEFD